MKKTVSLRNRFIYSAYLSIVCSVILITVISYVLLSYNSRRYTIRTNEEVVSQNCDAIELQMNSLERALRDIIYSQKLQELLRQYSSDEAGDSYEFRTDVNRAISGVTNAFYQFDNLAVFSTKGEMLGSMMGFEPETPPEESLWSESFNATQGETYWLSEYAYLNKDADDPHYVLPAVKKIRSLGSQGSVGLGEELGYLYVLVHLDNVLNFSHKAYTASERKIMILNQAGNVVGGSEVSAVGTKPDLGLSEKNNTYVHYEGNKYLATWKRLGSGMMPWRVVCLTPASSIFKEANVAISICFLISVVLLAVFLIISLHNADTLSRPIQDLEKNFEMVERGDFHIKIRERTNITEIDRLFSRFHVMAYRLDTLIHEVYEAKLKEQKLIADAREAEIQTLQMQINPHFLYNTLDSINWMALLEGNEEVSRMVLALGHLFRANMNTTGICTDIREEIKNLELFLYLEQVRFEDKLEYQILAGEEVLSAQILKHLLQPLVENSIKYGIEPFQRGGKICVKVTGDNHRISVMVVDNGNGIQPDKLKEIQALWENRHTSDVRKKGEKNGVGLSNIMKRLWLCYGEEAEFTISSSRENGTTTVIRFPDRVSEENFVNSKNLNK